MFEKVTAAALRGRRHSRTSLNAVSHLRYVQLKILHIFQGGGVYRPRLYCHLNYTDQDQKFLDPHHTITSGLEDP
ncbi:hypothetical protein Prudu_770S000300 [Prunus dulcis]|uniref:Uncharacterized protein n=1 Tax=Prunus dulcis TaxID=3755 RepID=A0A5H2XS16_PRUDU|nr:hypothetical protein Prudu_657S000100 [Prunus dulcis]BBN69140.1 hypothetical protein Prudu_770S000300 [Prunus dulcis]